MNLIKKRSIFSKFGVFTTNHLPPTEKNLSYETVICFYSWKTVEWEIFGRQLASNSGETEAWISGKHNFLAPFDIFKPSGNRGKDINRSWLIDIIQKETLNLDLDETNPAGSSIIKRLWISEQTLRLCNNLKLLARVIFVAGENTQVFIN